MKKYNFFAGPAVLPEEAKEKTIEAIRDLMGTGISLLEVSHRHKSFVSVMEESRKLFAELLEVPEGYHVLFLGGGASLQFLAVPSVPLTTFFIPSIIGIKYFSSILQYFLIVKLLSIEIPPEIFLII